MLAEIKSLSSLKRYIETSRLPIRIKLGETQLSINYLPFLEEPFIADIYEGSETIHYRKYKTKDKMIEEIIEIFRDFTFN